MRVGWHTLQFGNDVWDPSHRFETSWLFTPWVLFYLRAGIVCYYQKSLKSFRCKGGSHTRISPLHDLLPRRIIAFAMNTSELY